MIGDRRQVTYLKIVFSFSKFLCYCNIFDFLLSVLSSAHVERLGVSFMRLQETPNLSTCATVYNGISKVGL